MQFRRMAEFLFDAGYDCLALLLPGHGSDMSTFCRTPYGEWRNHVCRSIEKTVPQYDRIFLVGHSLGGLLCLEYASTHPISGLVLINTPLALRLSFKQISINYKVMLSTPEKDDELLSAYRKGKGISGRCKWYEYLLLPKQFINLLRHIRDTGKLLKSVNTRTLIVQSGRDETVRLKSVKLLKDGLSRVKTEELSLTNSYHSYFPPEEQQILMDTVLRFFRES